MSWNNVSVAVTKQYPELSKYCEMSPEPSTKTFMVANDACRVGIKCEKTVDGVAILKEVLIVEIDETTLEVLEITSVPWQAKP